MKTEHHPIPSTPVIQSGDKTQNNSIRRKWFALGLGGLLLTSICTLSPSSTQAQCKQWDVTGKWAFQQSNARKAYLDLQQHGTSFAGSMAGTPAMTTKWAMSGNIQGNDFYMEGEPGVYRGTVGPQGRIDGSMYYPKTPNHKYSWFSTTAMKCADAAPVKPPAPPIEPAKPTPRPIKFTGRMPKATAAPAEQKRGVVPGPEEYKKLQDEVNKAAAAVLPGWAGRWETRTAQGGHYEIIFVQNGDTVRGAFTDLNGNPQYNGSLSGDVSGASLLYEYSQPEMQATGKGVFELGSSGKVITGTGVVNDAAKTKFKWWGWKTN